MKDLFHRLVNKGLGKNGPETPPSITPSSQSAHSLAVQTNMASTAKAGQAEDVVISPTTPVPQAEGAPKLDGIATITLPAATNAPPDVAPSSSVGSVASASKSSAVSATCSSQGLLGSSMGSVPAEPPKMVDIPAASSSGQGQPKHSTSSGTSVSAMPASDNESTTLAVSSHCPGGLARSSWSVKDFELRTCMYDGNISMVYHAIDKRSGVTVALKLYKRYKLTAIERHQVAREIRLHISLAHPSIIAMYAAWKDRSYVYLALEWAPGGDIYQYLRRSNGRLSEGTVVPMILEPFLSGMAAIHDMGLIHRDIKPENILINHAFQVKIADFGLAIDSANEQANTRLGTIDYLAPEILEMPVKKTPFDNKENPAIRYTNKVDCWSCGVLAYELMTGQPPFASASQYETLNLIRTKEIVYPSYLTSDAVSFMQLLLVRDPSKRASLRQALEHPWIVKYSQKQWLNNGVRMHRSHTSTIDLKSTKSTPGYAVLPPTSPTKSGKPHAEEDPGSATVAVPQSRSVKAFSAAPGPLVPSSRLGAAKSTVCLPAIINTNGSGSIN